MEIIYLGHSSFKLRSRSATVICDPFNSEKVGLKFPKTTADVVTVSHDHDDHNFLSAITENPLVISGPGEYEVKGVKIIGVSSYHDSNAGQEKGKNTIYEFKIDGITIVHLGDIGHILEEKQIELISEMDILMIPVGGVYTITSQQAAKLASMLEPKMIIPMHYNVPGLNQQIFGSLTGVDQFIKEMGKQPVKPLPKLTITRDKLPQEQTIVVLES